MRTIQLLLALALPGIIGATDLPGTWVGTWDHNGESQGACLYLHQGDGLKGQIAYRHDTKVAPIQAKLPESDIVEFAIADNDRGVVNLRLKLSKTVAAEMVLVGTATTTGGTEPITLRKYTVPSIYYRFGKGRTDPVPIRMSQPEYTSQARAAKLQGTVLLRVPIEASGAVGLDVQILQGLGLGLDEEAVKCVREWQFTPPSYDCTPKAEHRQISVQFVLAP
jgi:TonB family protein